MLVFKEKPDLDRWRNGEGPRWVRDRISLLASWLEARYEKDLRVTAWLKDTPFHADMEAFDIGRFSGADSAQTPQWTPEMAKEFERFMLKQGIPYMIFGKAYKDQHYHIGDVATLKYERE